MNKTGTAFIIIAVLVTLRFFPVLLSSSSILGNFGDVYQHYYPLKYLVGEHIISGKMPLWNPYIFTGQPLLANPQSSVFYPPGVLFYFLPLVPAFNYFQALHIALAGFFFFLLLKYYKCSDSASLAGAAAYCFSSFLIFKITAGHPVALSGYIWLPLVILFTENAVRAPGPDAVILLALSLAFQFLSGHTFPLYTSLVFLAIYLAFHRLVNYKFFLAAFLLTVFVSAVQLLPGYELAQTSETGNWLGLARNYSLSLKYLINFVLPDHYGNIVDKTFVYPLNPSYFFENHCLYLGEIPLLLSAGGLILALKKKRYFYPLLCLSGVMLAVGFRNPLYAFFYDHVPAFNLLRVPARFIYLTIVSMLILSAFFWSEYLKKAGWLSKLVIFLVILVDLSVWGGKFIYPESMRDYRRNGGGLSAAVDPLYRLITEPGRIMPDKAMLYHHFNLNGYEAVFLSDFTRYLGMQEKQALDSTGLCRTDLNSPLSKAFSAKYLVTPEEKPGLKLLSATGKGLKIYELPGALPRIFFARSLKFFGRNDLAGQIAYLKSAVTAPDRELMLYREPQDEVQGGSPNYISPGKLVSYECGTDKVKAEFYLPGPATVVFTDTFYNGWRAAAGNASFIIARGHRLFRAVSLPAGDYTGANRLILYYMPGSYILGMLLTCLSLLLITVFYAAKALRRQEK